MTARTNLSSNYSTIVYKVGFPALFSPVVLIGLVVGLFNFRGDMWFFIILAPASIAWLLWFASGLKWVSIDDSFLYVAGLRKEVQIALSQIDRIEASFMQRPKVITLRLKSPSAFGKKISFVPEQRMFESIRAGHPLVDELRALMRSRTRLYK